MRFVTPVRPSPQPRARDYMKPLGDRRRRMRLEVVGSLWGTLEINREARIVNISRSGALIASSAPAAVDSIQIVRLMMKEHEFKIRARVRHLHSAFQPGEEERSYQLGLEFLHVPPAFVEALD